MYFTKKEQELLKLMVKSVSMKNSEFAAKLNVSKKEVRKMRNKIAKKLYTDMRRKTERYYK